MNNFKRYTNSPSPYSKIQKTTDLMTKNKMTLEEAIKSKLGTVTITAEVLEDIDTINTLQIPNMIAFMCKVSVNGRIVALGRGSSIVTPTRKVIEYLVGSASSSAMIDGLVRCAKSIDSLNMTTKNPNSRPPELKAHYEEPQSDPVSERQLSYLRQLINVNVHDEDERENRLSSLEQLTKEEASDMIEKFRQ